MNYNIFVRPGGVGLCVKNENFLAINYYFSLIKRWLYCRMYDAATLAISKNLFRGTEKIARALLKMIQCEFVHKELRHKPWWDQIWRLVTW